MVTKPEPVDYSHDVESLRRLMAQVWPERHDDLVELKVSLGVMGERIASLTRQVTALNTTLEKSKVPWLQLWAPIAFSIGAACSIYLSFTDKIHALELADQASIAERRTLQREVREIREGKPQ